MKIGIDLDNTINASKDSIEFFSVLTHLLIPEHRIVILTDREPGTEQQVAEELDYLGIDYSQIVITGKKADYILQTGITIYFENCDDYFLELPQDITVFKVRESHNFSFAEKRWIGSRNTTKMIDE